jgi:uncharacterized protein YjiS (DUF1127 family)
MKPTSPTVAVPHAMRLLSWGPALLRFLERSTDRHFQRVHLAELDDFLLRDIGLDRRDVERECAKPPWRR